MELSEITSRFGLNYTADISEIGGGHINNTFIVSSGGEKYILQRLNRDVFVHPEAVMKNISVLERIFTNADNPGICLPHFLKTDDGANFIEEDNEIYRMYEFSESNNKIQDKYCAAGFAFGRFIKLLSGRNVKLEPAIENFHSYASYFSALVTADKNSSLKKIDSIIMRRLDSLGETLEQVFTVDFPKRNIHGDAKISNLVLKENCTVIDLDTVMRSYAAIDYGDMIRSVCSSELLELTVIRDATSGFAAGLDGILTDDEIYSLYYGILYVTGELAVRYLIDYLSGDKYFRCKTSADCLSRANELLRQLSIFISHGEEITSIIYKSFKKK